MEIIPVSGTTINDLDRRRLIDYFSRVREQETPSIEDEQGWRDLLINTDLSVEEEGRISTTVAGLLLFGENPNRFLPQAGIDAVCYIGNTKEYEARERKSIRGAITPLYGHDGLLDNGLIEQVLDFVRRNIEVDVELEDDARRRERWSYPLEAVREAIVNAVVHRDYLLTATNIELSIYSDRMEIVSPGRLPNGITPVRMIAGCRAARNQLLKDIMRDYGYLEHMGMGVPRKIVKGMREHNGTAPELIENNETFTVRLWK